MSYVDKVTAAEILSEKLNIPLYELIDVFADIPEADVKPVVRGEWILNSKLIRLVEDFDEEFYVECSVCHRTEEVAFELEEEKMLAYAQKHYPFCHCGADMRSNNAERISETE